MAYFIPSSIQKRLLRYALSRLELLEPGDLDLANLDISLGRTNVVELHNVGLQHQKIAGLLQLPESLHLESARTALLRLSTSADVWNIRIVVQIEGVRVVLRLDDTQRSPTTESKKQARSRPAGKEHAVPTTEDIAKSFLAEEPAAEKTELEEAILSQSHKLPELDVSNYDGTALGTGVDMALPSFLAGYLQGIQDRLEISVTDVDVEINASLAAMDDTLGTSTGTDGTVIVHCDKLELEGLVAPSDEAKTGTELHLGKRHIRLRNLTAKLVSQAAFFEAHSRAPSTAPASPLQPHSPDTGRRSGTPAPSLPSVRSPLSRRTTASPRSERLFARAMSPYEKAFSTQRRPSVSESERYADASESGSVADSAFQLGADVERSMLHRTLQQQTLDDSMTSDFVTNSAMEEGGPGLGLSNPFTSTADSYLSEQDRNDPTATSGPKRSLAATSPGLTRKPLQDFQTSREDSGDTVSRSEPLSGRMFKKGPAVAYEAQEPTLKPTGLSRRSPSPASSSGESSSSGSQGLSESKLFTHEDAASMYMSAFSHTSLDRDLAEGSITAQVQPAELQPHPDLDTTPATQESPVEDWDRSEAGLATPRASSPVNAQGVPESDPSTKRSGNKIESPHDSPASKAGIRVAKEVLSIQQIDAWIPAKSSLNTESEGLRDTAQQEGDSLPPLSRALPGSFSIYADQGAQSTFTDQSEPQRQAPLPVTALAEGDPTKAASDNSLHLSLGPVNVGIDTSTVTALLWIFAQVQKALQSERDIAPETHPEDTTRSPSSQISARITLDQLHLHFHEQLSTVAADATLTNDNGRRTTGLPILGVNLHTVVLGLGDQDMQVDVRNLSFELHSDPILSFGPRNNSSASIRDPLENDLSVIFRKTPAGKELSISTLPLRLAIDVHKIDQSLGFFGGLSGILELSSSISSPSPSVSSPAKATARPRGVRFARQPDPLPQTPLSGWKVNSRLAGLSVALSDRGCGVSLDTTSVKIVGRERAVSASISQLQLSGPYIDAVECVPPLNVRLENTRLDFLFAPEETDLTKLVSLITPSRDKYDDDDDILLDTLLRQRQKGSLLRVNSGLLTFDLTDMAAIEQLQCLGEELSRLQSVAKYLPEDDRPGLLTMINVKDLSVKLPVEGALRKLSADAHGLRLGHVGIPPLMALSLDRLSVMHGDNIRVVCEVLSSQPAELPMVMARMIGDEMVPTIKIKLFNLCMEYRVSTIMALLGLDSETYLENLTASIASIVTVTGRQSIATTERTPTKSGQQTPKSPGESMHIELLFRECALGLNPHGPPSKGLILLSNAAVSTQLPVNETYTASLDIGKAYLLVVDDVATLAPDPPARDDSGAGVTGSHHVLELCQQGFVSIGTMSKSYVQLRSGRGEGRESLTEVNIGNELFVMESCADSTRTMIDLFGALSPPKPPTEGAKYRTKVVPMADMMASFTGDAVVQGDQPEMVDVEEDDFTLDVDMVGSFYQPRTDNVYEGDEDDAFEELPENELASLKLVRPSGSLDPSFGERTDIRCQVLPVEQPFVYEDGYYAKQAGTKSKARKWDSTKNEYGLAEEAAVAKCPLKVHLNDLHLIWNLFDGYDWARTRHTIEKAVQAVETLADERRREKRTSTEDPGKDEVIGDFLFNSIWIEVPANRDPRELARNINREMDDGASETGSYTTMTTATISPTRASARTRRNRLKLQRGRQRKVTFELKNVSADMYMFPPDSGETQMSLDLRVGDLEVFDHVPSSTWKKFATYMQDAGERELGRPMIRLELLDVKPIEELVASEAVLRVTVLPLRLHVDQDALDFITRFFEFKPDGAIDTPSGGDPFIQRIEVNTVAVKLDYKPKKIDYAGLRSGHTTEFMNFFILDNADIMLRHCIIYGVSGFDRLHQTLNDIWMPDVKRNQLPTVLAGLAPIRPLVNVGSGVRDLVYIPMKEYRKDGRIVRSVQKGAVAFARTTTSELARLGAKLAMGTQNVLEGAEGFLSLPDVGTPRHRDEANWDDSSYPLSSSPSQSDSDERRASSNYADQPIGVVAGLRSAARSLERDLLTARDAIVAIPGEIMDSGTAGGAARVIARRAPTVILRTARGASKAMGVALLGAGNALDRDSQRRIEEKYKRY